MSFDHQKEYKDNGVVLVKNFLTEEELDLVKKAIQYSNDNPSPFSSKIGNNERPFFHDYWTYKKNNFVKKLLSKKKIIEKIKTVTGNKSISFFHDHILVKNPGSPSTPWHHDRPYYFIDGPNNFSIWITPDYINEENSLAFCKGSHKSKNTYVPVDFNNEKMLTKDSNLKILTEEMVEIESKKGILSFRMKPGDAIFFHNRTLHRSLPSSSNNTRSALSLRMIGDDCFLTKICCNNPQPPFHKFGMELTEGAKPSEDWFPSLPFKI